MKKKFFIGAVITFIGAGFALIMKKFKKRVK